MTPKQKAEELIINFMRIKDKEGWGWAGMSGFMAKQCAMMVCDELLPIVNSYEEALSPSQSSDYYEWWEEVKQEIEKQ